MIEIIVGIVFVMAFISALAPITGTVKDYIVCSKEITATLSQSKRELVEVDREHASDYYEYRYQCVYNYKVNGETYEYATIVNSEPSEKITIKYNPKNPSESIGKPRQEPLLAVFPIVLVIGVGIGLFLRVKQKSKDEEESMIDYKNMNF